MLGAYATSPAKPWDVLIVGGGPGGSATAIGCAQAGLRVLLIERAEFPRPHVGETLHPGVEPLLDQLGVADHIRAANFLRHIGIWIEDAAGRRFMPYGADHTGTWQGFHAWRATFDALLLERARELGTQIVQPCAAHRPISHAGRVVGIQTPDGPVYARWIVDASGGRHWLARHLRLPITPHGPRLIARYGYATGASDQIDHNPTLLTDPSGWTWTAHVQPHVYHWTRLRFANDPVQPNWLPPNYGGLRTQSPIHSRDVTWRRVAHAAGPGYFLIGDAAAVLDPASSHGVLKALMSGIMAAHLIKHIYAHALHEQHACAEYDDWVARWFAHDVERLREMYSTIPGWRDVQPRAGT